MKTMEVPWSRQLCEHMIDNLNWRKYLCPHASEAEGRLGCFLEDMEPQVLCAVLSLREKGYGTIGSGFTRDAETQYMQWVMDDVRPFEIPSEATVGFTARLVVCPVSYALPNEYEGRYSHALELTAPRVLSFREWTEAWDRFANSLPVVGPPAGACGTPVAVRFRENYVGWLGKPIRDVRYWSGGR